MERENYTQSRKFERFQTVPLDLECDVCGRERAKIRDISFGGAGILVDQPPEVGSTCVLGVETAEGSYKIVGEVIWAQSNPSSPTGPEDLSFTIGLRFDKGSLEAGKDLVFSIINKT